MDGWDSITICAQIKGAQPRFSRMCNLITLSVPRPLLLFATRRCHSMLKISGSPSRRLARQTPIRGYWESTMRLPIECPGLTEEVLFVDAILAEWGWVWVGNNLLIHAYASRLLCQLLLGPEQNRFYKANNPANFSQF